MTITAAADGSALGNPGPAGWGWYVDADHWASGGWKHGTNNMGELKAVHEPSADELDLTPRELKADCRSAGPRPLLPRTSRWRGH